jgi:hypothetical protein
LEIEVQRDEDEDEEEEKKEVRREVAFFRTWQRCGKPWLWEGTTSEEGEWTARIDTTESSGRRIPSPTLQFTEEMDVI